LANELKIPFRQFYGFRVEGPDKNVTGLELWMSGLEIQVNG